MSDTTTVYDSNGEEVTSPLAFALIIENGTSIRIRAEGQFGNAPRGGTAYRTQYWDVTELRALIASAQRIVESADKFKANATEFGVKLDAP